MFLSSQKLSTTHADDCGMCTDPADSLPLQQYSTIKLVVAFQCSNPRAAGIGPQTFIEAMTSSSEASNDGEEHALFPLLKVYFPSLRNRSTNSDSDIHTCVVEGSMKRPAARVGDHGLEQMLLARLARLFPSITEDTILGSRLIMCIDQLPGLSHSTERYRSNMSAKTDIQHLYIGGCEVGTFGVGGCLQAGWVSANAVLGYTASDLLAGRNVLNDILYE